MIISRCQNNKMIFLMYLKYLLKQQQFYLKPVFANIDLLIVCYNEK